MRTAILALQVSADIASTNISTIADVNNDGRIGVEEAIHALQVTVELRNNE